MFKARRTEQLEMMELEKDMDRFLSRMLNDGRLSIESVEFHFLDMFPGEEDYFKQYVRENCYE